MAETSVGVGNGDNAGSGWPDTTDLPRVLAGCREAAKAAYRRTRDANRAVEAQLEALETEVASAIERAESWGEGTKDALRPLRELQDRLGEVIRDLRIDMSGVEQIHERTDSFRIALFGRTKAGKSTLCAALTREPGTEREIGRGGERTTKDIRRYSVRGITFTDVPGICAYGQGGRLDEELARTVIEPADVIFFLLTDDAVQEDELAALVELRCFNKPLIVVQNLKLDLSDGFNLRRARKGKDGLFDRDRLGEHRRRITRYFKTKGVAQPDTIVEIHADAAFRSWRERDSELARWYRGYSRIVSLERCLVEHANNGPFIRVRTYAEPLVRYLEQTCHQLESASFVLRRHRKSLIEKRKALIVLLEELHHDFEVKLGSLEAEYAAVAAEADTVLERAGTNAAAEWRALINGPRLNEAAARLAAELSSQAETSLAEFRKQSEYDAGALARQVAAEVEVEVPVVGRSGRWWRHAGTAVGVIGTVGAAFASGGLAVAFMAIGWLGKAILSHVGNTTEKREREEFITSRGRAKQRLIDVLEKKKRNVMAQFRNWLEDVFGPAARKKAGVGFDEFVKTLSDIQSATRIRASELRALQQGTNRWLLEDAARRCGAALPTVSALGRIQGTLTKAFVRTAPGPDVALRIGRLMGERIHLAVDPRTPTARVVVALEPARIREQQVRVVPARLPGEVDVAEVKPDSSEIARAIGVKGSNCKIAGQLCGMRIKVTDGSGGRSRE